MKVQKIRFYKLSFDAANFLTWKWCDEDNGNHLPVIGDKLKLYSDEADAIFWEVAERIFMEDQLIIILKK
jgi:hypothetical protein